VRVLKILPLLKKTYPDAKIAPHWDNLWNLLVAAILSAQRVFSQQSQKNPRHFRAGGTETGCYRTISGDWLPQL